MITGVVLGDDNETLKSDCKYSENGLQIEVKGVRKIDDKSGLTEIENTSRHIENIKNKRKLLCRQTNWP